MLGDKLLMTMESRPNSKTIGERVKKHKWGLFIGGLALVGTSATLGFVEYQINGIDSHLQGDVPQLSKEAAHDFVSDLSKSDLPNHLSTEAVNQMESKIATDLPGYIRGTAAPAIADELNLYLEQKYDISLSELSKFLGSQSATTTTNP